MTKKEYTSILLPGFEFSQIKGIQAEKENNRVRKNQPSFAVKIDGINKQLPGTADILKPDFAGGISQLV